MSEYSFDGTDIKFRFCILDATGLVKQSGITSTTITAYKPDRTEDAVTETVTEIATTGVYEASIPYSEIDRSGGDGLWTFIPGHSNPDLTFQPQAIHIQISRVIGTVNTTNFTPTTTQVEVDGLSDTTTDHYKDAFVKVIKSSGNRSEIKKITASILANGRVKLTFNAMTAALSSGDMVEIIDR